MLKFNIIIVNHTIIQHIGTDINIKISYGTKYLPQRKTINQIEVFKVVRLHYYMLCKYFK